MNSRPPVIPRPAASPRSDRSTQESRQAPDVSPNPVDAGQAEVLAFPSKKQRRRRGRGFGFVTLSALAVVILAVAAVMAVVYFTPVLALKTITVDGADQQTQQAVTQALQPLKGTSLTKITEADVLTHLSGVATVKNASIEARPPSTLLVHVQQRVPVAVMRQGNQAFLVDQDGKSLGAVADPKSVKLPLIEAPGKAMSQDAFTSVIEVLSALPSDVRAQMVSATASTPDSVSMILDNGRTVIWGNAEQMQRKADALKVLLTYTPQQQPGKPAPAPIKEYDVSSPTRPVTR